MASVKGSERALRNEHVEVARLALGVGSPRGSSWGEEGGPSVSSLLLQRSSVVGTTETKGLPKGAAAAAAKAPLPRQDGCHC